MALQKPFELKYPAEYYTPYGIAQLTDKQLREEYTRMRDAAQKRVKRLATSEFSDTSAARQYGRGFAKLGSLTVKPPAGASAEDREIAQRVTRREIEQEFMRMSVFLRSPEVSVKGLRQRRAQTIEVLRQHGYDVTVNNYRRFTEFMEYARQKYGARIYDSEQTADIFGAAERAGLSFEAMDKMLEKYHEGGVDGAREVATIVVSESAADIRKEYAKVFGLQEAAKAIITARKR